MATGRKFIGFNVDTTAGNQLAGFMQQMAVEMNSPAHIGPVLKLAHAEMANEFTMHMAALAPANPSRFHHVYEWDRVGDPNAKLWKDVLRGGGNSRVATFEWRASKSVVPVREDVGESKDGNRPKQIHVFVWKAPMMEYGTPVTIGPKRGNWIAYFTGPYTTNGDWYQELRFTTHEITVNNPGGTQVVGAFTKEYISWWAHGGADSVFKARLNKIMAMNTRKVAAEGLASIGSRSRRRTYSMQTAGSSEAAFAAGKAAARKAMSSLEANYIEQAKAREAFLPE